MLQTALLIAFALNAVIHLYSRLARRQVLKKTTKCLILALLLAFYLAASPQVRPVVVLALLFSWAGDILLIPNSMKCFVAGGISFTFSHLCFMLAYFPRVDFELVGWQIHLTTFAIYLLLVLLIFHWLRPYLKRELFVPMRIYLAVNGLMNCVALWQHMSVGSAASAIAYIGALLFFISDSILFYVRFVDKYKTRSHFCVMLTYILGEFMIVLGLMLLGA